MGKYVNKQIEIDALQFTGSEVDKTGVYVWAGSIIGTTDYDTAIAAEYGSLHTASIRPSDGAFVIFDYFGEMVVNDGDWIVKARSPRQVALFGDEEFKRTWEKKD